MEGFQERGRGGMGHERTARKVARSKDVGLVEIVLPLVHVEFIVRRSAVHTSRHFTSSGALSAPREREKRLLRR